MNIEFKEKYFTLIPFKAPCAAGAVGTHPRRSCLCCTATHSSSQKGDDVVPSLETAPTFALEEGKGAGISSARPEHGSQGNCSFDLGCWLVASGG